MVKYIVIYEDRELAGFTDTNQPDEDLYLWRDGTNWHHAVFDNRKDAQAVIIETNKFRKRKGWKPEKFKILTQAEKVVG